jgi:hypothetical protein
MLLSPGFFSIATTLALARKQIVLEFLALEQTCQLPGYNFVTAESTIHFNLPALSIGLGLSCLQETLYVV